MEGNAMFEALLLLALAFLAMPIVALVLSLIQRQRQAGLDRRVEALERRLAQLAAGTSVPRTTPEATQLPPRPAPLPPPERKAVASKPPVAAVRPARVTTPPARRGWQIEQQLGTRAAVWLGAVALALAGAFLVKYSIDQGLIGPAARVALGLGFGVALLGGAEWLRSRSAHVAQGLAASGIAVLYAALLAGTRLYGLFPELVGGLAMALTTAIAVVLSTRHGPIVAVLGLLGGFLTPIWIGSETPSPWMLLSYLVALQAGLFLVTRRRRWNGLALATQIGALGWGVLWLVDGDGIGGGTTLAGLYLLGSIVAGVLATGSTDRAEDATWSFNRIQGLVGTAVGVVLMGVLVGVGEFGWIEWTYFVILGGGSMVLALRQPRYESLPWLAAAVGAITLATWGASLDVAEQGRFMGMSFGMLVLYVGGSYVLLWRGTRSDRWAALAGLAGIVYLLVAYTHLIDAATGIAWGLPTLILACVFAALAVPVYRSRDRLREGDGALAALAVSAAALVTLAVPMEFDRQWIGLLWSLEIPALVWLAGRLRLRQLELAACAVAALVLVRLVVNPGVLGYPIGDGVPFNWTLYGYGVPAAALLVSAWLLRRIGRRVVADAAEIATAVLGFVYLSLNVRQFFNPGRLDAAGIGLAEIGAYTVVWGLYALFLLGVHRRLERPAFKAPAVVCAWVTLAHAAARLGVVDNPLFQPYEVGALPVVNSLLFVYGAPAAIALWTARAFRRIGATTTATVAGVASLVFAFLTLTLEVRQAFHGNVLSQGTPTNAEMYTYSLVWILFATALLVAGILTRGPVLRYGSAAVMLVAVAKVFLLDLAHLQDLYRVFSLFGLGVSLMLLAYLYQRFVFGSGEPTRAG
jgi:uncharacterized membrane protein